MELVGADRPLKALWKLRDLLTKRSLLLVLFRISEGLKNFILLVVLIHFQQLREILTKFVRLEDQVEIKKLVGRLKSKVFTINSLGKLNNHNSTINESFTITYLVRCICMVISTGLKLALLLVQRSNYTPSWISSYQLIKLELRRYDLSNVCLASVQ